VTLKGKNMHPHHIPPYAGRVYGFVQLSPNPFVDAKILQRNGEKIYHNFFSAFYHSSN
jgi:hypothetical protein